MKWIEFRVQFQQTAQVSVGVLITLFIIFPNSKFLNIPINYSNNTKFIDTQLSIKFENIEHSNSCTPAPKDHFLFLPFNTDTGGDWLDRMTAVFDHHYPDYTCSMGLTQQCLDRGMEIALWEGERARPIVLEDNILWCYGGGCGGISGYEAITGEGPGGIFYDGHNGYDWAIPGNDVEILAAASGRVSKIIPNDGSYGWSIVIDHLNGYKTKYSHLKSNSPTKSEGDCVEVGEVIAFQGNTGKCTGDTGYHLHFTVFHGSNVTDPFGWCYFCAGSPPDPLQDYNGEVSQNLWYGTNPRTLGLSPTRDNISLIYGDLKTSWRGGPGIYLPSNSRPTDQAIFIKDISLPDGTVVSPGQSFLKTWRMKNTGSSTWGSGYKLVFVDGEQMGAPNSVDVPSTSPGQEVDISVPMTAPDGSGDHIGRWRLRNPQGTYFGDPVWIKIYVASNNPGGHITIFDITPASPSDATQVHIVGRAIYFSDFRSMRFVIGNEVHEMENIRQVGDQNEISFDWNTGSLARGDYAIVFEVAKHGDPDWASAERQVKIYTLTGTPASNNHAPDRPVLKSPYNWYLKDASGANASVELCVHPSSDPDGNPVQYYYEVKDQGGGVYANSGWVSSTCWSRSYAPNTYSWRVKTGDGSAESDWSSDTWNFSVAGGGVYIGDHAFFNLNTNVTHMCIFVTYDGIQAPEVKAFLNKAPDGSESGEWRQLDHYGPNTTPDCTQANYHGFWIHSPEYETGNHKIKVTAVKQDSGNSAEKVTSIDIAYIKPPDPTPLSPSSHYNNGTWWNTRTIDFEWDSALRTDNYTLRVSTSYHNPWDDPSPLFEQSFGSSTTSHTHTFSQDYNQLYWSVRASNSEGFGDTGTGVWFGVDLVKPSCQVEALPETTYESVFQVNWSGIDDSAGVRSYNVQYRDSTREEWNDWLMNHSASKPYELFVGQPGHTYYFRCRATDNASNIGDYPEEPDTNIMVDPTSRPPAPWWDENYSYKRSLIIQNNMPGMTLPVGYPVHLHFDSGTVPTAAEIYNASQSSTKCDDLRIISSDVTQLSRLVESCSSDTVDIRFQTNANIPSGSSNNVRYQFYYGNPNAVNPPANPVNVWPPPNDANTRGLWYLSEGTGSTSPDVSGYGNHITSVGSLNWNHSAKFGNSLSNSSLSSGPSGAYVPGNSSLGSGAFTFEAFVKRDAMSYGIIAAQGESNLQRERWALLLQDGKLKLAVWPWAGAGDSQFFSSSDYLTDTNWHHIAVTFDGNNSVKFYRDGVLTDSGTLSQSGINNTNYNFYIGSGFQPSAERFFGIIDQVKFSSIVRTSFPHAAVALIINEPSLAAGQLQVPPSAGSADLVVHSLTTYPNPDGGIIVEAVVENQGDLETLNGFFTDLYVDHIPTGSGDYTGSLKFWVNDPIGVGETVTLITVIEDLSALDMFTSRVLGPASETTATLYAQTDSEGAVPEEDDVNNIFTEGTEICTATADAYEDDNGNSSATLIAINDIQTHNFDKPDDQDWIKFEAEAGQTYTIKTFDLDTTSDTFLYLYDTDGSTLLASNDDYGESLASRIEWEAPITGSYYALVKHWNPNHGGCGTSYSIQIAYAGDELILYLPLIYKH